MIDLIRTVNGDEKLDEVVDLSDYEYDEMREFRDELITKKTHQHMN